MEAIKVPYIISFPKIGNSPLGYISVAEKETLPFTPKRIYWTYFTPEEVERGNHAHFDLEQILIVVVGKVILEIETIEGEKSTFILDRPDRGVFLPKLTWRTMKYTHNAVQICLASQEYQESDYIRNYDEFKKLKSK